jgi:hypothetical protein
MAEGNGGTMSMKIFWNAAAVVAILASSTAHAAELTEVEKAYIWMDVAATIAKASCGAREIPGGMFKMGERNGIDVKLYGRAIIAAASAAVGMQSDLIPGVTQVYRLAQRNILDDMDEDKAKTCGNWIPILRHVGIIEER